VPTEQIPLLHRLVGGDPGAASQILALAPTTTSASVLVAAAMLTRDGGHLTRAADLAAGTRERQLVVLAETHLEGNTSLLDVLVRDHLADHPDHLLAAWIAGQRVPRTSQKEPLHASPATPTAPPLPSPDPHHPRAKEITMTTLDHTTVPTPDRRTARLAGAALALASGLAIAGFTVLGSVFQYPQILEEPTADILARFRDHQGAVTSWFLVLAVSAALMAPAGILLGQIASGRLGRAIGGVGIAAATVQVVGLQRWVTLVPGISGDARDPALRADAEDRFELWHTLLGKAIGETLGYALTATFTVLVVVALRRSVLPRWLAAVGYAAAVLIATGVVIPVIEAASLTNFVGYVAWCAWLLAVAVLLFRVPRRRSAVLRA
jgi:Domain of unknown function (DUF4386)